MKAGREEGGKNSFEFGQAAPRNWDAIQTFSGDGNPFDADKFTIVRITLVILSPRFSRQG
jgi:hypothetical protein